jgi:predicted transcriptional regulator
MRWKVNEKHAELSECELITMKCIWDAEHELSCSEVMDALREQYNLDYKDTTVYTFLKKLKEKGFVDCYRRGVTWFIPARDQEGYRKDQLRFTRDFWYKGSASQLLSELVDTDTLSDEERQAIKDLAQKL